MTASLDYHDSEVFNEEIHSDDKTYRTLLDMINNSSSTDQIEPSAWPDLSDISPNEEVTPIPKEVNKVYISIFNQEIVMQLSLF